MKNTNKFWLAQAICWVILFSSCTSGAQTTDGISLSLNLKKKQHFTSSTYMEAVLHESILTTNMNLEVVSDFDIVGSNEGKEIRMTYMKLHSGQKHDSSEAPSASDDKMQNVMNDMAIGKYLTVKLNKQNTPVSYSALQANNSSNISTTLPEPLDSMARNHINNFTGFLLNLYPGTKLKPGESWTANTQLVLFGTSMNLAVKYTLLSIKNGVAEVDIYGKISGSGNMRLNNDEIVMELSGVQIGNAKIKVDNSELISANFKVNAKAEADIMGTKLPMDMIAEGVITR